MSSLSANVLFQGDAQLFADHANSYRSGEATPSGSSTQYSPPPAPEQTMYPPDPSQFVDAGYGQSPQHHPMPPPTESQQLYYSQNINDLFNMTTPVHPAMQPSFFANAPLAYPDASTQIAGTGQDAWSVFMSESVFPTTGQAPQNQNQQQYSYSLKDAVS